MKYIRTKDGRIFEKEYLTYEEPTNTWYYHGRFINDGEAIAEANTVEELCDLFAYNKTFVQGQMLQEIKRYYGTRYQGILYAYTFGENGDIIKVAKMNEKGELELL